MIHVSYMTHLDQTMSEKQVGEELDESWIGFLDSRQLSDKASASALSIDLLEAFNLVPHLYNA